MALPPIAVQLTKFENIEILRAEIEKREEELKESEKSIRSLLYEIEKAKYLKSLHPYFLQVVAEPAEAAQVPMLHVKREALNQAIETMKAHLAQLEAETLGQTAPPSAMGAGGAARPKLSDLQAQRPKNRFDNFGTPGGAPPPPPAPRPGIPPPPPR